MKQKKKKKFPILTILLSLVLVLSALGTNMISFAGDAELDESTTDTAIEEKSETKPDETPSVKNEKKESKQSIKPMDSSPLIEISNLSPSGSYEYNFNLNQDGKIILTGDIRINDAAGGSGGKVIFKIESLYADSFDKDPVIKTIPDFLKNPQITRSGDEIVLTFDVVDGQQYSTESFTIELEKNKTHSGFVENKKAIAKISVEGIKGESKSSKELTVQNNTGDQRSVSISKTPTANTKLDVTNKVTVKFSNKNSLNWNYQPGTEVKMYLDIPIGSTVDESTLGGGVINGDRIEWIVGTADEKGQIDGDYARTIGIIFPSGHFNVDDDIDLQVYAEYTLAGSTPVKVNRDAVKSFKIDDGTIHLNNNAYAFSSVFAPIVDIGKPDSMIGSGSYGNGSSIKNDGTLPIPDLCMSWSNDSDNSGKKSKLARITISGSTSAKYKSKIIFYIKTGSSDSVITKEITTGEIGSSGKISFDISSLKLNDNQYIDKFELYPQSKDDDDNAYNALPYKGVICLNLAYSSWKNGVFPNGTEIKNMDKVKTNMLLSWKDETFPESFKSNSMYSYDEENGISQIQIPFNDKQYVYFSDGDLINPVVSYSNMRGVTGLKAPGDTIQTDVKFYNYAYGSVVGSIWKSPEIVLVPPKGVELIENQSLKAFNHKGIEIGDVEIKERQRNDAKVYILSLPESTSIGGSVNANTPITIKDLSFRVTEDASPGTYYLSNDGSYTSIEKNGLIFPSSSKPYTLFNDFSESPGSVLYDNNKTDWAGDGRGYLKKSIKSSMFSVEPVRKFAANAEMWNTNSSDGPKWENVNVDGAEGIVPLAQTGKYRFEIKNNGNTYFGDINLLNILPRKGNKTAYSNNVLNSLWDAGIDKISYKITDRNNNDVTDQFSNMEVQYCTNNNPTYTYGNNSYKRIGSKVFANDTNDPQEAGSFAFMSGSDRLPPGYSIVFDVRLSAPSTLKDYSFSDISFNSFALNGSYYTSSTGTAGKVMIGPVEPKSQKFVLTDSLSGELNKKGFAFIDVDKDDLYESSVDKKLSGAAVKLYVAKADKSGPDYDLEIATTVTDDKGQYEFKKLAKGDYFIVFSKPHGNLSKFVNKGDDDKNNASHINDKGESNLVNVQANTQKDIDINCGISMEGYLKVEIYENDINGSPVSTITQPSITLPATGAIKPQDGGKYSLPTGYMIKDGTPASQSYSLDFDEPMQTLKFIIEKAKYQVDFKYNDGTGKIFTSQAGISHGGKVDLPSQDPVRKGYTFAGWYSENIGDEPVATKKWNFDDDEITTNTTLYAGWNTYKHEVTFISDDADKKPSFEKSSIASPKTTIDELPEAPQKDGFIFNGWNTDLEGKGSKFNEKFEVSKDMMVYAQWKPIYYQLSFNLNGAVGKAPDTQSLKYNDLATPVKDPLWTKYKFLGWKTKDGQDWDFEKSKMPLDNIDLFAHWEKLDASEKDNVNLNTPKDYPDIDNNNTSGISGNNNGSERMTDRASSDNNNTNIHNTSNLNIEPGIEKSRNLVDSRLEDAPTPLSNSEGKWALINMILAIAGIMLSGVLSYVISKRKQDNDSEEKTYNKKWYFTTMTISLTGILLFVLTQDLSQKMTLVDHWTIANVILFVLEVVSVVFLIKSKKDILEEELKSI